MHRLPVLEMLVRYGQRFPEEEVVVRRIRRLVEDAPDCFDRSCLPGHITGSAWVLSHDRGRCLLLHHGRLARWLQPGGHADGSGDIVAVARREVEEETGLTHLELIQEGSQIVPLDVDVHRIPARYDADGKLLEPEHEHHDLRFLFVADREQMLKISSESNDLRWFSRDEVGRVTDEPSVLRMLHKAGPFG